MKTHDDVARIAAEEFSAHKLKRTHGKAWRMAKPGTGTYSFRVTWTPGAVVVTGDIGTAVYEVWPSFSSLWEAVELIARADYDYLTGKSGAGQEFDREATVAGIIRRADEEMAWGQSARTWEQVVEEYGDGNHRDGSVQMKAARALREDGDLTAEGAYRLTGDFEAPYYSWPARTRWTYEAVRLWARAMLAAEPAPHRWARQLAAELDRLKRISKRPVYFRPQIYTTRTWLNGSRTWVRMPDNAETYRAVGPLKAFGLDLSKAGLWQDCWTTFKNDGERYTFEPAISGAAA